MLGKLRRVTITNVNIRHIFTGMSSSSEVEIESYNGFGIRANKIIVKKQE